MDLIDRQALLKQIDIDSDGEPGYYGDTWKFIDTIKNMPPAELSTNLAEVGTDCISRQQAIDGLRDYLVGKRCPDDGTLTCRLIENEVIEKLPPIQPDIVRCKDCRYYNSEEKECLDLLGHGRRWEEDDFCSYAERREVTT